VIVVANYWYLVAENKKDKEVLIVHIASSISFDFGDKNYLEEWFTKIDAIIQGLDEKIEDLLYEYGDIKISELSLPDFIKVVSIVNDLITLYKESPTYEYIELTMKLYIPILILKLSEKDFEYRLIDSYSVDIDDFIEDYKRKGYKVVDLT